MVIFPSVRRFFCFAAISAACLAITMFLLARLDGRLHPPPDPDGRIIRELLLTADKLGGAEYSAARRKRVHQSLNQVTALLNRQRATPWYSRDFRPVWSVWQQMQTDALGFFREVTIKRDSDRLAAAGLIEQLSQHIEGTRDIFDHTGTSRLVRNDMTMAEMRLREAGSYFTSQYYRKSLQAGQEGLLSVRRVEDRSRAILSRFDEPFNIGRWQEWIRQAVQDSKRTGGMALVVNKDSHKLEVYQRGQKIRTIPVDLGANSIYQKMHEGDRCTPEGRYRVTKKKGHGATIYTLALLINYPNDEDRARFRAARENGEIPRRRGIGGLIEIHGQGGRGYDWTDGCVAPGDEEMRWLYQRVPVGTPVIIVGSDGSQGTIRTSLRESRLAAKKSKRVEILQE